MSEGGTTTIATAKLRRPASREVITLDGASSFRFYVHDEPHPFASWHYHPEYEVHLILKSSGRFVLGDVIGSYVPGQLMLIGPNLPHSWIADREPREHLPDAHAVLHFTDGWIRACQAAMPELRALDSLLRRSGRGIEFHRAARARATSALLAIRDAAEGAERVVRALDLLRILAAAPLEDATPVVRAWVPHLDDGGPPGPLSRAIDYIFENLATGVRLHDAARIATMSDSAFSRYFKARSGQKFTDMVRQLRLTQACRLLESTDEPITAIATTVGYSNLSNFNRQFLQTYGKTPRQQRAESRVRAGNSYGEQEIGRVDGE